MSFAKPDKKSDTIDDSNRLLCTHPGCGKIWTVNIERPYCSFHQWGERKAPPKKFEPKQKTAAQWYDDKDEDF